MLCARVSLFCDDDSRIGKPERQLRLLLQL